MNMTQIRRIQDVEGLTKADEGIYVRMFRGKLQIWEEATPENVHDEVTFGIIDEGVPVRISPTRVVSVKGSNIEFIDMLDDGKRLHEEAEHIKEMVRGPSESTRLVNTLAAAKAVPEGDIYADMRRFKEETDQVKADALERRGVYGSRVESKVDVEPEEVKAIRSLSQEMDPDKRGAKPVTLADVLGSDEPVDAAEAYAKASESPFDAAFAASAGDGPKVTYPLWMKIVFFMAILGGVNAIEDILGWVAIQFDIGIPFLVKWGFVTTHLFMRLFV